MQNILSPAHKTPSPLNVCLTLGPILMFWLSFFYVLKHIKLNGLETVTILLL